MAFLYVKYGTTKIAYDYVKKKEINTMINILQESIEYIEKQLSLNEKLDNEHENRASKDGIFCPDIFFASGSKRIVFVLKETYSPVGDFAYSPVLNPDNTDSIRGANRASRILVNSFGKEGLLSGVGYMNISKKAMDLVDGKTNSKGSSLRKSYLRDKEYVWEQLKAMNPRYVICGGTFGYLWKDLKSVYGSFFYRVKFTSNQKLNSFSDTKLSLWRMKDNAYPVFIQTYHPSCPGNVFKLIPEVIQEYEEGNKELILY